MFSDALKAETNSFKHLAVRGWFRQAIMGIIATRLRFQSPRGEGVVQTSLYIHFMTYLQGFNHLAVRGWFRLQTHKPAWLCGKLGFEF